MKNLLVFFVLMSLPIVQLRAEGNKSKFQYSNIIQPIPEYRSPQEMEEIANKIPDRVPARTSFKNNKQLSDSLLRLDFIGPMPIDSEYWSGYANASGRVTAIAVEPTDSNIAYIGGAQGGVWKTTDGGVNWTPLTDYLSSLATGALAISPQNPQVIYYGTGEQDFSGDSYYGDGLFKSTNGGSTWVKIAEKTAVGSYIARIIVDPSDSMTIHLVSDLGYLKSTDGGFHWNNYLSVNWGTDLVMNPDSSNILIAAIYSSGLWKTTDGGSTWTQLTNGLPSSGFGRINLAISESNPSVIYASFVANSSSLYDMYKTVNGGNSWDSLPNTPDYLDGQGWYDNCVIVDPTNPDIAYAGGVFPYDSLHYGLIKTTDGGNSWTDITIDGSGNQLHPDQHILAFGSDGTLWVGNDGGIWKTTDGGTHWINLNHTLGITQFYTVAVSPDSTVSSPDDILGGTQDNGTVYYSGDIIWRERQTGDGGPCAYEWDSPNIYYTSYVRLNYLLRWNNGSYEATVTGPWESAGDRVSWCNAPLIVDPNSPNTLLAGTYRVWKTSNSGASWDSISGDLTAGGYLRSLAIADGDSNIIYSGSSDGRVYMTTDGGSSWNRIDQGLFGSNPIGDIWLSPTDTQTIYLSVDRSSGGRVYTSNDSGQTWTDITGDLPSGIRAQSLAIDFSITPPTLYLGTDYGMFISFNQDSHWVKQVSFPNLAVYDIAIDTINSSVIAATHGRGMWISPLATGIKETLKFSQLLRKRILPYPNPAKDFIWVEYTSPFKENLKAKIVNLAGQIVEEFPVKVSNSGKIRISTKSLNSGVYFIVLEGKEGTLKQKFIKIKSVR